MQTVKKISDFQRLGGGPGDRMSRYNTKIFGTMKAFI